MADSHRRRGAGTRRAWLMAGLAALILVDIVLVAFALFPDVMQGVAQERSTPGKSSLATKADEPVEAPAVIAPVSAPPTRLITAVDDSSAWRTTTGECPASRAILERTVDGGATWRQYPLAPLVDVRSVTRIEASDSSYISVIGRRGPDCSAILAATYTGGRDWKEFPAQLADAWFVDPTNRATIHTARAERTAPCDTIVSVAIVGADETAVLCSTQMMFRSSDGGLTWDAGVLVPGAASLDDMDREIVVATTGQPGCAGVQMRSIGTASAGGASDTPLGCVVLDPARILPGETAVSFGADSLWLWAGDVVVRSLDRGVTWE
jgi:hypothetical protein